MDAIRVTPADVSVPIPATTESEASLRQRWARGSTDSGFALGLLLWRSGRSAEATEVWSVLAESHHPEALYTLAQIAGQRGDRGRAEELFRASDAAGGLLGSVAVSHLERDAANQLAFDATLRRVQLRATALDEAGSADAALIVAGMDLTHGDIEGARHAYSRAEERGAPLGSLGLAKLELAAGNAASAVEYSERAERAGIAAGSYLRAIALTAQRSHREARTALHRAALSAWQSGDGSTFALAMLSLRPYGKDWWRLHPWHLASLIAILIAVTLINWRSGLALLGLVTVCGVIQRPVIEGLPIRIPRSSDETVSLLGVRLDVNFDESGSPAVLDAPQIRSAARGDVWLWRIAMSPVVAVALLLPFWAARVLDDQIMVRSVAAAAAWVVLVVVIQGLRSAAGADELPPDAPSSRVGFRLYVPIVTALSFRFRSVLEEPRLEPLVLHHARVRRERSTFIRRLRAISGMIPGLFLVGVLATLAIADSPVGEIREEAELLLAVIEGAIIVGTLLIIPSKVHRAIARNDWLYIVDAVGYLLAVSVTVLVIHLLGLDAAILTAFGVTHG